ncbi:MAG: cation transporter [Firmicutes bacterium]|nr:cation transporter [Bacillota bacterium]
MSEEKFQAAPDREKVIVRTSVIGILANIFLAAFKAGVGILSNSIAVILDAVNNLSDALSSVITIIGTRLASRRPDRAHPLGHGRVEYLSSMIVSAIVLYAGITSLVESVKKIIHPETPDYSTVSLVIIASAVVVKILLGRYVKKKGEEVNSGSLIASGSDATFDAILSASVLLSAIVFIAWGISLEAWVGAVIAVFIIRAGLEMLSETLDEILGKRTDDDFSAEIKKTLCEEPEVTGAYDLILHNYGPDRLIGSVHVEVPGAMNAAEIDALERRLAEKVYAEHGVVLAGIGIYSTNEQDSPESRLRHEVTKIVMEHEGVLQMHGFYADLVKKTVNLDVVLDFALPDRHASFEALREKLQAAYPDLTFIMTLDLDV